MCEDNEGDEKKKEKKDLLLSLPLNQLLFMIKNMTTRMRHKTTAGVARVPALYFK